MRVLSRKAYVTLLLGDISILYLSVWAALALRHFSVPSADNIGVHLVSFSLLFPIWFVVYFLAGLYGRYTVLFRKQLPNIIFAAQFVNMTIAALFFFLVPFFAITPKTVLVLYLLVSTGLLFFWRVYMYPNLSIRREIGAILVGTGQELTNLAEEVNRDPVYPLEFRAIVHPELADEEETKRTISDLVQKGQVSTIVADMGNHALDKLLQFIYDLTFVERSAVFLDVRRLYQEIFEKVPLSLIDDRWLLRYVSLSPHTIYDTFKRAGDIVFGLALGILSLLLYPFIIVAMRVEGEGPIFYTTQRIGLGGKAFSFTKFRSMTGCDENDEMLATKHTVTKVGKFLRRSRLDELPQLWGIVKGDLSFVGPRPEFPALVSAYRGIIPHYNLRHLVKPGLSGWAQIKHENHGHHSIQIEATREKLAYDLYYIKERSLWLDFYIALLTTGTVLVKKGS